MVVVMQEGAPEEQVQRVINRLMEMGFDIHRSTGVAQTVLGALKPRTSPYSFQGLGKQGLELLRRAADKYNLLAVSEVMDLTQIPMMIDYVDIFQVGARNMQNYNLLKELGKVSKPILLKRGISATIEEMLLSSEYIMSGGNYDVVLCER